MTVICYYDDCCMAESKALIWRCQQLLRTEGREIDIDVCHNRVGQLTNQSRPGFTGGGPFKRPELNQTFSQEG